MCARTACTTAQRTGRSIALHPPEALLQTLRTTQQDSTGTVATGFALLALVAAAIRDRFVGPSSVGLVLFVAGGSSNWIDRVLHGRVVDFLNLGIGPIRTGVFNVADVAIMIGAGLVALGALHRDRSIADERTPPNGVP